MMRVAEYSRDVNLEKIRALTTKTVQKALIP